MQYQIFEIVLSDRTITNIKKMDGDRTVMFPLDLANTDYQAYLAWLAEGNSPIPANDEGGNNGTG